MSQKSIRKSKYAANDDNFIYSSMSCYIYDDFAKLSIKKVQCIARTLMVPNISNTNKEKLIQSILHKHNERHIQALAASEDNVNEILSPDVPVTTFRKDTCFSEYFYKMITEIRQYYVNGEIWFEANRVASLCDYKIPQKAIHDHVHSNNKVCYETIQPHILKHDASHMHPKTVFINEHGISQLMYKSRMPKVTGKEKILEEVYVATTVLYQKDNIFKIGKAENSIQRLHSMNTSRLPNDEMYLCYSAKCYDALNIEQHVHRLLNKYRVVKYLELFRLSLDEIVCVVNDVCNNSN